MKNNNDIELSMKVKVILTRYAQQEAKKVGSDKVDPEHIFLGLLKENAKNVSLAIHLLRELKVDLTKIRTQLENQLKTGNPNTTLGELPRSARCRKVLDLSAEEAGMLSQTSIGTEHLLIGLFKEGNEGQGLVHALLAEQSVSLDKLRNSLEEVLGFNKGVLGLNKGDKDENSKNSSNRRENLGRGEKTNASKTATIDNFSTDLTKLAREKKLDPVIGREKEIERVIQILCRRNKNNPILIGEPGVGKSAIVEGLATAIVSKQVPEPLFEKRVLCLDLAACIAGTKYRGEFEERIKNIMNEVKRSKKHYSLY